MYILLRSLAKDYTLVALAEEDVAEWETFVENPLQRETSEWPLLLMETFKEEELTCTLTEKDKELLEQYLRKTSQNKQVVVSNVFL